MSGEGFLRRWARRKTEVREGREPAPAGLAEDSADAAAAALAVPQPAPLRAPAEPAAAPARPLPTLEDVAALDADSDFSAFVARGVDQAVRRGALKKLFADPHFKVMDKLDVYIDDYTKPSPMSETMLASLEHAKSVFMKMVEDEPEAAPQAASQAEPQTQQPPEQETQ
ncbi:DUF3306 domain-containing protein [Massilia sp. LXY-6]|uniref:DUF3306 domain-containing protein n=1 Tax=Massilia sp. LXY-6 TaxID=3379823 RepID=UPI003EE02D55